jgi:glycosyltransferase involved in cell wall biosynthesis
MVNSLKKYARKSAGILKREGILSLTIKGLQKIQKRQIQTTTDTSKKIQFVSLVRRSDVLEADWSTRPYVAPKKSRASKVVNWVMSPPSNGGGHQNIFRFIDFLDDSGYTNNVYLYSTYDDMTPEEAARNVSSYSRAKRTKFHKFDDGMEESDILFATGWETAYPVFNAATQAKKMYFVQDFEPYFYAMGTNYVLAENTYRFGFHGITAGGWLGSKLAMDYGMKTDHYDFGSDPTLYRHENDEDRKKVFFYARPVTERRGFDLGVMALELFHEQHPEYEIVMAGWDVSGYDVPFPYTNHKSLSLDELSAVYNECSAALVISLTNMSLLPLELLSCGTIPVVNEGNNNSMVSSNPYIVYTPASPAVMAREMSKIVSRKDAAKHARKASASVDGLGWAAAGEKFMNVIKATVK